MDIGPTTEALRVGWDLRDGYEVHCAALSRGMDVTLLPRQVLMVGSTGRITGDASFVHGVPEASTVSGVTFAQDKRVRRALLQRGGFTVPKGATFSIGRSAGAARRYAESLGYPVVVKPAMGDNTIGVLSPIESSEDLRDAVEYLHTPVAERDDYTRGSYAMTELREPGVREGKLVSPPSYRFLIENHIAGDYVRLLVLDGTIFHALHCPQGPWRTAGNDMVDVTQHLPDGLTETVLAASRVIPGLPLVAVDVIVPDVRAPVRREDVHIVEYSERPWLACQHTLDSELVTELATKILAFGLGALRLEAPQCSVAVDAQIKGVVDPISFLKACARDCEQHGLTQTLDVTDNALGHIGGRIEGDPRRIAWLMENALDEGLNGHRAMMAEMSVAIKLP